MGPNLAAILSYFSGRHHLGKRGIEELVETVFEVPISLGMVTTLESEMSAALAPAHDEAKDEVRAAAVKNADETGWKQAGRLLVVDGGDGDGGLLRDPCAAERRGPAGAAGRGDPGDRRQRPLGGL